MRFIHESRIAFPFRATSNKRLTLTESPGSERMEAIITK
ncbi:hypothetical protein AciX9_3429 [Granulicella tundricola MP5ACTX9]|uniref:Uncharacterized protein n=1 Tax=Granulicella tundricola (strain ATCC BAA-1859 / DSM 23138 / MP5ACTX9) TaxID=1198114 RepID=E8X3D4_GRATM|nr:hypothetical protein AciX9_3429 [Granulicella tundricola MP5ACTX9]